MNITVTKCETPKCERCRDHNGVPDNPLGICDRCVAHVLAGLPAFIESGTMTQAEADEWLAAITASRAAQLGKYRGRSNIAMVGHSVTEVRKQRRPG